MADKRPKRRSEQQDGSPADGGGMPEGDDSIEILEVVGFGEDGAPAGVPKTEPVTKPAGAEEDSIPYSRRELYDRLLRKQAEFDNARKRLDREREEARRRIWMDLLQRLLPILDNFDRALAEPAAATSQAFRQGVVLTCQQMRELLAREGMEEISALGERFDPHLHEAVETRAVEGFEAGIVLEELRKGYRFQGQLLRPSLVRVSAEGRSTGDPEGEA